MKYILGKIKDLKPILYNKENQNKYIYFNPPKYTKEDNEEWLVEMLRKAETILIVSSDISGVFKEELDFLFEFDCWTAFNLFEYLTSEIEKTVKEYFYSVVGYPLADYQTVKQLIEMLQEFDPNLPVAGAYEGWIRENEYYSVHPRLGNLKNQNVNGDPQFYGSQECVVLK